MVASKKTKMKMFASAGSTDCVCGVVPWRTVSSSSSSTRRPLETVFAINCGRPFNQHLRSSRDGRSSRRGGSGLLGYDGLIRSRSGSGLLSLRRLGGRFGGSSLGLSRLLLRLCGWLLVGLLLFGC